MQHGGRRSGRRKDLQVAGGEQGSWAVNTGRLAPGPWPKGTGTSGQAGTSGAGRS